jgi:hypothetical protein
MTKLTDWIDRVAAKDKTLAALLRGLVFVLADEALVFVWHSPFHKDTGSRREPDIRTHLGGLASRSIRHITLAERGAEDPMLNEALALGARVKGADPE